MTYDWVVVGAGFAGSVLAERLANDAGATVLLVDRRFHVGGNAYDHYDDHGVLVHKYGPHIFHTNARPIIEYLSRFTEWRPYQHRVLASVDGQLVPLPINLDTINRLYGLSLDGPGLEAFFEARRQRRETIATSEDVIVDRIGTELYHKFFRNYTRKQWGLDASELDSSVISRVPIRTNRDDRYFTDTYQLMPLQGYTRLFERMLAHPRIHILLNTDWREVRDGVRYRKLVFTGPVDEFFDHTHGRLPYRSLRFEHRTHDGARFQQAPVINFPNEYDYTRVTEFKWLTGQEHDKTSIVYEFPTSEGDPYYPIPRPENAAIYKKYQIATKACPGVWFVGRLATYRYYNMDQVVGQAVATYQRIRTGEPAE